MRPVLAVLATLAVASASLTPFHKAKLALQAMRPATAHGKSRLLQEDFDPEAAMDMCSRAPATACCTEFVAGFSQLTDTCPEVMAKLGPSYTQQEASSLCTDSCFNGIADTFRSAASKTGGICEPLRAITDMLDMKCLQDSSETYCAPLLNNVLVFNLPNTTAGAAPFCGGCVDVLSTFLGQAERRVDPESLSGDVRLALLGRNMYRMATDLVCSQDPMSEVYCLVETARIGDDESGAFWMPEMCTTCGRRVVAGSTAITEEFFVNIFPVMMDFMGGGRRTQAMDASADEVRAMVRMLRELVSIGCARGPGSELCGSLFEVATDGLAGSLSECQTILPEFASVQPTCSETCGNLMDLGITALGCCFPGFFHTLNFTGALPAPDTAILGAIRDVCDKEIPTMCMGRLSPRLKARFANVKFEWAVANRETFVSSFQDGVANILALEPDHIAVTNIRSGSVVVDFTVRASSNDGTNAAVSAIREALRRGTATFARLDAVFRANAEAALENPMAPVTVSDETDVADPSPAPLEDDAVIVDYSGATAASSSLAAAALVAALAAALL